MTVPKSNSIQTLGTRQRWQLEIQVSNHYSQLSTKKVEVDVKSIHPAINTIQLCRNCEDKS